MLGLGWQRGPAVKLQVQPWVGAIFLLAASWFFFYLRYQQRSCYFALQQLSFIVTDKDIDSRIRYNVG